MKNTVILLFLLSITIPVVCQELTKSELERNNAAAKIYKETSPQKKERIYNDWLNKYPPGNFSQSTALYDYVKIELAKSFSKADQVEKAIYYANDIVLDRIRAEAWVTTADELLINQHLEEARVLYQKARDKIFEYYTSKRGQQEAQEITSKLPDYDLRLAKTLHMQNKLDEALKYIKEAQDSSKTIRLDISNQYISVLMAKERNREAFAFAEKTVIEGAPDDNFEALLFELYKKINGEVGFNEYRKKVVSILLKKEKQSLVKEMINVPAPNFSLRDLDGKTIRLSDLRGKIVLIDFWATWCIPCLQSFPYMQTAVDFYKDSTDVAFLFIHTWEHEKNAPKQTKKFIDENHYSFHVLMDMKDPVTEVNNVVENYKIGALPAKLIIDKAGNIRFIKRIFNGSNSKAVEEIKTMVELVSEQ